MSHLEAFPGTTPATSPGADPAFSPAAFSPAAWVDRWDVQQRGYIPAREERFAAITEVLTALLGDGAGATVLDLGCGPGSTTDRVLRALPGVQVVAVDLDPVLIELARATAPDPTRVRHVEADLRDPHWVRDLGVHPGGCAAVVSTTALHWLDTTSLQQVYRSAHRLLAPGGVLLDGDHLRYGSTQPVLARLAARRHERSHAAAFTDGGVEDYGAWHAGLRAAAPDLDWDQRAERFADRPTTDLATDLADHVQALRSAGFTEVDTVWQRWDDRVLCAVAG